ncbi:MAG: rRNA pseudouridine synthase [Clostridia bacterium]|nr:rRNA pseudouridine synthase [Clostridia bacterium]
MKKERLDKYVSNQLNISRSAVRTGIMSGKASVNGETVKNPAAPIDCEADTVFYSGNKIEYKKYVYLMLNKPAGIITASSDKSRKTVLDLVPYELRRKDLAPVGRLDKDTTGLLIITDDGEFAHKCISPKSNIEKSYIVELDGDITEDVITSFRNGVTLADGYICKPAKLFDLGNRQARVVITEGKYHQIKRMFGVFSLGVNALHRESFGSLKLPPDLGEGECAEIGESAQKLII